MNITQPLTMQIELVPVGKMTKVQIALCRPAQPLTDTEEAIVTGISQSVSLMLNAMLQQTGGKMLERQHPLIVPPHHNPPANQP